MNEFDSLARELNDLGSQINVLVITDTRGYTLLTYAADKNFDESYQVLYNHAMIHNVSDNETLREK